MSSVLSYVTQFFTWLGNFTDIISNNIVISSLVFLVVGVPLILSLIRRKLW